jgi:hypothetical protein
MIRWNSNGYRHVSGACGVMGILNRRYMIKSILIEGEM